MINLSAVKVNLDHEIELSKQEQTGVFTCTLDFAELLSECL